MKKTHKLILVLLILYFTIAHVTYRLEISSLMNRSADMEALLLQQARQQEEILANQEKSRSSGNHGQPQHPRPPNMDQIPDLV